MSDVTVSVRVDKQLHEQMKLHEEINWSAILRQSIEEKIEEVERIDFARAERAARAMDRIRKTRAFDHGKSTTELIREWRDKRR